MDDSTDDGSSIAQTLASVFTAGLGAYVDSQNKQSVTVTTPSPQTAYGYAGYGQPTPSVSAATALPPWLWPLAMGLLVYAILRKK